MDSHSRSASPPERPQHRPPSPPSPPASPTPGLDNRGFSHDEDHNHNDSFASNQPQTNGKQKKALEAVNLELVNMTPKKKDTEVDMNATNPYDEYFVPVNEHRKYMRGEKLYVTQDKRGDKAGCKRPLCWTLLGLVVVAIVVLIVLAATGVLFTSQPSPVEQYNSSLSTARALGGVFAPAAQPTNNDESEHKEHDHNHHDHNHQDQEQEQGDQVTNEDYNHEDEHETISTTTPSQRTSYGSEEEKYFPSISAENNDSTMYVPRTVEGELKIDNEEFTDLLNDSESDAYRDFVHSFNEALRTAIISRNDDLSNSNHMFDVEVVQLRKGSIIVTYRIHWNPKGNTEEIEDLLTPNKLKKMLNTYLQNNNRMLSTFHIADDRIETRNVLDMCQINKHDCQYGCKFDESSLDFVCTCPPGQFLNVYSPKKCLPMLESEETTLKAKSDVESSPKLDEYGEEHSKSPAMIDIHTTTESDPDLNFSHILEDHQIVLGSGTERIESKSTTPIVMLQQEFTTPEPEPTAEPSAEPTPEPVAEPTAEPAAEPTPEPIAEPAAEPAPEPTAEPVAEPTAEVTVESAAESVAEPTAEPAAEPTPEPSAEPSAEPAAEPAAEPTAEPAAEPTSEPVADSSAEHLLKPDLESNERIETTTEALESVESFRSMKSKNPLFRLFEKVKHTTIQPETESEDVSKEFLSVHNKTMNDEEKQKVSLEELSNMFVSTKDMVATTNDYLEFETTSLNQEDNDSISATQPNDVITTTSAIPSTTTTFTTTTTNTPSTTNDSNVEAITNNWLHKYAVNNKQENSSAKPETTNSPLNSSFDQESKQFISSDNDIMAISNHTTKNKNDDASLEYIPNDNEIQVTESIKNDIQQTTSLPAKNMNETVNDITTTAFSLFNHHYEGSDEASSSENNTETIVTQNSLEHSNKHQSIFELYETVTQPERTTETTDDKNENKDNTTLVTTSPNDMYDSILKINNTRIDLEEIATTPISDYNTADEWISAPVTEVKYEDMMNKVNKDTTSRNENNLGKSKDSDDDSDYLGRKKEEPKTDDDSIYDIVNDYNVDSRVKRINKESTSTETTTDTTSDYLFDDSTFESTTLAEFVYKTTKRQKKYKSNTLSGDPAPVWEEPELDERDDTLVPREVNKKNIKSKSITNSAIVTESMDISSTDSTTESVPELTEPSYLSLNDVDDHLQNADEHDDETNQAKNLNVTIYEIQNHHSNSDTATKLSNSHSSEYVDHDPEMSPFLPEVENNKHLVKKLQEGHDLEPINMNETQNENTEDHNLPDLISVSTNSTVESSKNLQQEFQKNNATEEITSRENSINDIKDNPHKQIMEADDVETKQVNSFLADTDDLDVNKGTSTEFSTTVENKYEQDQTSQTTQATVSKTVIIEPTPFNSDDLSVVPIDKKQDEENVTKEPSTISPEERLNSLLDEKKTVNLVTVLNEA